MAPLNNTRTAFVLVMWIGLFAVVGPAVAGPLEPPAGPVTPTPGPEPRTAINEVNTPGDNDATPSLFKITVPGSYYLAASVTGVSGKNGIEIATSGVTIDLNGFDVAGVPGSLDAIASTVVDLRNISILNGSVRNWGGDGVDLLAFTAAGGHLTRVSASGNGTDGLRSGSSFTLENCTANHNGDDGILAEFGSTVGGCSAGNNGGAGIVLGDGAVATNSAAYSNGGHGFFVNDGCLVQSCTSRQNGSNGITVARGCTVSGNTCSFNGTTGLAAGVLATGADNRIDGNQCTSNDYGIRISTAGNMILRNTCSGNTTRNYEIAINNRYGPIINITASGTAAVSGNSAPDTSETAHPWANFAY